MWCCTDYNLIALFLTYCSVCMCVCVVVSAAVVVVDSMWLFGGLGLIPVPEAEKDVHDLQSESGRNFF